MRYFRRLFIKNILTALKNTGDIGVHVTEVEVVTPIIRTQMRIRFHLLSGSPGFNIEQLCKELGNKDRVILDNKHHPLPTYYFTFSSRYSVEKNILALCQAISRSVHNR